MSFNMVVLEGHLTRDPALSYTPTQTAVVAFGLATNETWTGADGQKNEKSMFIECVGFGKTAENLNKYFAKGDPILIQGKLQLDQWTDKASGAKRSKHKVSVFNWTFPLGKPADNSSRQALTADPQPRREPDDDISF